MKHLDHGWKLYILASICFIIAAIININIGAGFCVTGICFIMAAFIVRIHKLE